MTSSESFNGNSEPDEAVSSNVWKAGGAFAGKSRDIEPEALVPGTPERVTASPAMDSCPPPSQDQPMIPIPASERDQVRLPDSVGRSAVTFQTSPSAGTDL